MEIILIIKMSKTKVSDLLKFGLDSAVLWNTDREKEIDNNILIVQTLKHSSQKKHH